MPAIKQLVIIGAGGFGRETLAWAEQSLQFGREWEIRGFIDDNVHALDGMNAPGMVLSTVVDYVPQSDDVFICAIGVPAIKRRCCELLLGRGAQFTRVVHRTAVLGHNVELAEGVILCPHSVVSANNRLGFAVAINLHATVDHDATVGDWSQINCHCDLTAAVNVGKEVFLGSRVSAIPGVTIGDRSYIGAGAVVTRDIPPGTKAYGIPARAMGRTD